MDDAKNDPLSAERVRNAREWIDRLSTLPSLPMVRANMATVRALADAHLAGGWRPIETAPRDKPVRLWAQSYGEISRLDEEWREFIGEYFGAGGDAAGFEWIMSDGDAYAVWLRPSHWMPCAGPPPA
jgi:hypothetical protein